MSERHSYITKGISRETFQALAQKLTMADAGLTYFIHGHAYRPFDNTYNCFAVDSECQLIKEGKISEMGATSLTLPATKGVDSNT